MVQKVILDESRAFKVVRNKMYLVDRESRVPTHLSLLQRLQLERDDDWQTYFQEHGTMSLEAVVTECNQSTVPSQPYSIIKTYLRIG